MIFAVIASVIAIPATHLDILPMDENHPAVMHDYIPTESFASSAGVLRDIQQLESFIGQPFEKNWSKLPPKAELKRKIWAGPYWPTYADGINKRWAGPGSLSAVEKYAEAFGLDAKVLSDAVSRKSGVDSQPSAQLCTKRADCEKSECAIRVGQTEGRCIPRWFGICHAWAPVAMVEDEPMKAVTVNNVTFEPLDVKALITQLYDTARIGTIFTGQRCNIQNPPKDSNDRMVNEECRDISPDYFHLVLTNYIGRFQQSFVADLYSDYEVWNHPVISYEVRTYKTSFEDAMKNYFPNANTTVYPFNPNAKELLNVFAKMNYITESDENTSGLKGKYTRQKYFEYLLELDEEENIIGGEWIGNSKTDHPDFIYVPTGPPNPESSILGGIKYSEVKKMIELAQ
jgi:hypothetical protein